MMDSRAYGSSAASVPSPPRKVRPSSTIKRSFLRQKKFRDGRAFNCPECGPTYDIHQGHAADVNAHFICCELCLRGKSSWHKRNIYYCSCTDPLCPCPKGPFTGRCKRLICAVCLFERNPVVERLLGTEEVSSVPCMSISSSQEGNRAISMEHNPPSSTREGLFSFKSYVRRMLGRDKERLESILPGIWDDENTNWPLCCQCLCHRVGVSYAEFVPNTYRQSQLSVLSSVAEAESSRLHGESSSCRTTAQ